MDKIDETVGLPEGIPRRSTRRSKRNLKRPKLAQEPTRQSSDNLDFDIEPVVDIFHSTTERNSNLSRFSQRSDLGICDNEFVNERRASNLSRNLSIKSQTSTTIQVTPKAAPKFEKDPLVRPESRLDTNRTTIDVKHFVVQSYSDIYETSTKEMDPRMPTPLTSSMINNLDATRIKDLDNTMEMSYVADDPNATKWTTVEKTFEATRNTENDLRPNSTVSKKTISLTWTNLNVTVKKTNYRRRLKRFITKNDDLFMIADKKIVNNFDGFVKPNNFLAIMGASGSGKTTLINALAFRNRNKLIIDGEININGKLVTSFEEISSVSGYLQQEDLFYGFLTVQEHLTFQAMLRMDALTTKKDREKRVSDLLKEFNLETCANNAIYLFGNKGISGGEKRRLALASEILTDPNLLFCDEPTSGLDSFMACSIVQNLSDLAKRGKTIICTIHQPSSEIFEMFDYLCLVVEGRLAFFGSPSQAKVFFKNQNLHLPPNYNPADFYIKSLAIQPYDKENSQKKIRKICNAYENSPLKRQNLEEIKKVNSTAYENSIVKSYLFKANFFNQLRWLLWRNIIGISREPFTFFFQIIQNIAIALMFGLIYLQLKYNQEGVMNMNGYIFLCLANNGFATIFFVVASFPLEIPVFLRENQSGTYRIASYYLSKLLIDVPIFVILPIVFMIIAYWMGNLNNNADRFFICVVIIILVVQCSLAFGSFISAIAPNATAAIALAGPILVPLMIFSGFLLNFNSIPNYFVWLRYLSWFSYAYENLMINQWQNITGIECPVNSTFCFKTGQDIIAYLKVNPDNYVMNFCLLFALIIFYRALTLIALSVKAYFKSK